MNSLNFISPYGYKPIFIVIGLAFLSYIVDFEVLENIFIILALFLIYVYRDTTRHIFENNQSILSPIDGKVIAIDSIGEEHKVYLKVNLCNNHNLRAPFSGTIRVANVQHGVNLNPNSPKGQMLNEQVDLEFVSNDNGKSQIDIKLISGFANPNIVINTIVQNVSQGDKVGFFIDGTAIITLKNKPLVNIGDKLKASQSILAKID